MSHISAGDMVMVTRCCGCPDSVRMYGGMIFRVQCVIYANRMTACCTFCNSRTPVSAAIELGDDYEGRYPLAWVQKIEPLPEEESAPVPAEELVA